MKYKSINLAAIFSFIVFISGCSTIYDKHVQWQTVKPDSFPVLHAIGQAPISLQKTDHQTQKMLMAITASKIAAYAELAEQVYGQKVNSKSSMTDLLLNNQQLNTSVQGVIRGAKVVKSYPVGDTYITELSLDFADVYNIIENSLPKSEIRDIKYY